MNLTEINHPNKNIKLFPILITISFFLIVTLVSFYYHTFWTLFDQDALLYLTAGQQILDGNGKDVSLLNAGPAGPILYALLEDVTQNGLFATKLISIFSGTAIVFFSYYTFRNIFNYKIALLSQLFIAFNPWIGILSITSQNDLTPIALSVISLYFITKDKIRFSYIILAGSILGLGFMFRTQPIIFFFAIIFFLLLIKKNKKFKLIGIGLFIIFFILLSSPMFYYNLSTQNLLFDSNTNYYIATHSHYSTPEWKDYLLENMFGDKQAFLSNQKLFLENYFYNLFYGQPSNLFGFENKISASLIPAIPIVGLIPALGGLILLIKISPTRKTFINLIATSLITTLIISLLGNIEIHFFAIIIIPLIFLGIQNFKKLNQQLIVLLTILITFSLCMAVLPLRSYKHFLYVAILLTPICSYFIIDIISRIVLKSNPKDMLKINFSKTPKLKYTLYAVVITIIITNLGYSFVTLEIITTGNSYDEIVESIMDPSFEKTNKNKIDYENITEILKSEPDIENKYVMANQILFADSVNAKWIGVLFTEGQENDSIKDFITRKNWKNWEITLSNINSNPMIRGTSNAVIPDYLLYIPRDNQIESLKVLADPGNPNIPKEFQILYNSPNTEIVLYKIDFQQ